VQLLDERAGTPRFLDKVNVPGEIVLLAGGDLAGGAAEHTAFALEPRYSANGDQSVWLERMRLLDGSARRDRSLELGPNVLDARASGNFIAVLSAPDDYCAEGAVYSLQVVDAESATPALSRPLLLPSGDYGWGLLTHRSAAGIIQLRGGPAQAGGTLSVDLRSDPPSILGYEY
jgi:hypothetical protein